MFFKERITCPACLSNKNIKLCSFAYSEPPISSYLKDFYGNHNVAKSKYFINAEYILDECLECGLIFQRFFPNDFLMRVLYNDSLNSDEAKKEIEFLFSMSREVYYLVNYFQSTPERLKVFDFGMGWGDWCRVAIAMGCDVFGSEISQLKIEYAKKIGVSIVNREDLSKYKFDYINTEQVFEHIPNPLEILLKLSNSLKSSGIIKISVPNGWDIKRRLRIMDWSAKKYTKNSLNPIAPLEHINCFSENSLKRMSEIANLSQIDIRPSIRLSKRILNLTLKDIIRPVYLKLRSIAGIQQNNLCLYFQKK